MKKILPAFLIIFCASVIFSLYFLDKEDFSCPIAYQRDILIRNDTRGKGFFAARRNGSRKHQGIDLLAEMNTPVLAARFGVVIAANSSRGMGNFVIIRHPGNITTVYGHLAKIHTACGRLVRQGEVIGAVGKTGNADHPAMQPHLHFEVKKNGIAQDPLQYLQ